MSPKQFSEAVLAWFDQHGRTHLPWQHEVNAYRVWVSEIMLQQTQVASVIGYFERFMQALPRVQDLAAASLDEVLHLWTGLGYYSRARNLHQTAQIITEHYAGHFPERLDQLIALPGIGRSTAGAVLSLGLGKPAAILDGNVKRVLARFAALPGYPGDSAVARKLWLLSEKLTPLERCGPYNQAMMDLGATLCTKRQPDCARCPLHRGCKAYAQGNPYEYPEPKKRQSLPQKTTYMPLLIDQGCVLLYRRPASGLWGGLWSLPELAQPEHLAQLAEQHGLALKQPRPLCSLQHRFSHFILDIHASIVSARPHGVRVAEGDWLWYKLADPPRVGLAAPVKTLLKRAALSLTAGELA